MRVTSTVRLIVVGSLLVAVAGVAAVASEGSRAFRIRDDCDPATFNAAIGAGTCKVTFDGDTTFQKFINELTEDKTVGAWRFNPDQTDLDRGQRTSIESRGGEFHTFTRVADFGGGIVPVLNTLAEAGATRPECGTPGVLAPPTTTNNFVPSGAAFPGPTAGSADLPKGTTKWQCCIHPWMRATITVK
jgi:hypothetical protein